MKYDEEIQPDGKLIDYHSITVGAIEIKYQGKSIRICHLYVQTAK